MPYTCFISLKKIPHVSINDVQKMQEKYTKSNICSFEHIALYGI